MISHLMREIVDISSMVKGFILDEKMDVKHYKMRCDL